MILIKDVREGMEVRILKVDPETAACLGIFVGDQGVIVQEPGMPLVYFFDYPASQDLVDDPPVLPATKQSDALVMVRFSQGDQAFQLNDLEEVSDDSETERIIEELKQLIDAGEGRVKPIKCWSLG